MNHWDQYHSMRGETAWEQHERWAAGLRNDSQAQRNSVAAQYAACDVRWAIGQLESVQSDRDRLIDEARD